MRMIVQLEKSERVRHVGHLDLQRAMQRVLRRSGLPVAYSQGFHPHMQLSFASPLPVGVSGAEELLEVGLAEPIEEARFAEALAEALPPDLPLGRVRRVEAWHPKLMASLVTASYCLTLPPCEATDSMIRAVDSFLARTSIPAIRKTKKGESPCDIRPMLHELTQTPEGLICRVSLTETSTLKPDLLLRSLAEHAGVEAPTVAIRRLRLFGRENGRDVPLIQCQGW